MNVKITGYQMTYDNDGNEIKKKLEPRLLALSKFVNWIEDVDCSDLDDVSGYEVLGKIMCHKMPAIDIVIDVDDDIYQHLLFKIVND